jgi:type IV pilus assembly protein PilC
MSTLFPSVVLQMCAIGGEESGSIDHMLGKGRRLLRPGGRMVAGISSLMEPIIIVILGTVIRCWRGAMYLPIFKLGAVV